MSEDMSQPPRPVQPVSMHGEHHSHGSLHLIVGLLGVLLVLVTVAMGYVVREYMILKNQQKILVEDQAENTDTAGEENGSEFVAVTSVPVFAYVEDGKRLYIVNNKTGESNLAYAVGNDDRIAANDSIAIFAIPKVGYEGKIYLSSHCNDCDGTGFNIYEFDLLSEHQLVPEKIGSYLSGSVEVSPDQTRIAYVPLEASAMPWSTGKEIVVMNLLTGEEGVIAQDSGFYFFSSFGKDDFRGSWVDGFNFFWSGLNCVTASVYERPQTGVAIENGNTIFVNTQEFCQE